MKARCFVGRLPSTFCCATASSQKERALVNAVVPIISKRWVVQLNIKVYTVGSWQVTSSLGMLVLTISRIQEIAHT